MQVVWRFSAFAHEQPDAGVWSRVAALTQRFDSGVAAMRLGVVGTARERDALAAELDQVPGAVFALAPDTTYDDGDRAVADYVAVFPAHERLLVANTEVLVGTGPCPGCGLEDAFDVAQSGPFVIGASKATSGSAVDTSALPGGGMAVSPRLLDVLEAVAATGWTATEIGLGDGTRALWSQLVADRAVLVPSARTEVDGDGFCPSCGRALGSVLGRVWVDPVGLDVFARHPGRRAMLCFSRRLLDALAAAGIEDLELGDPLWIVSADVEDHRTGG